MKGARSEILSAASFWQDPFGSGGFLYSDEPLKRVWLKWDESQKKFQTCTITRVDPLLDENKRKLNESQGKRYGDGKVVGSIPMEIWTRQLMPAVRDGDIAYQKKWLNDSDNRAFRTFGGRL